MAYLRFFGDYLSLQTTLGFVIANSVVCRIVFFRGPIACQPHSSFQKDSLSLLQPLLSASVCDLDPHHSKKNNPAAALLIPLFQMSPDPASSYPNNATSDESVSIVQETFR
eukprot:CAMPEP_0194040876 /NCGR_PEP_ID=MMETSP0009_2-20130614/12814_1 /TAXON_ID=210454 /ORGANISM="Grammatophora oceanica, Strain CCMP 410" /LENGTH=110 /DNA_ID=CAMNT_0038684161 /DNA_START=42 /DNA_END=370 /DNA_ORIENTATION=+